MCVLIKNPLTPINSRRRRRGEGATVRQKQGTELKYYGESLTKKNAGTENKCNSEEKFNI